MSRRLAMRVVLCGACLVTLAAPTAPARASDELGLSTDGQTWVTSLATPLFDPSFRWVPGDVETASFHVRNQGPTRAVLTIEVVTRDPGRLIGNDDLEIAARVAGGAWQTVERGGSAEALLDDLVPRGDRRRVDVRVRLVATSPNRSQGDAIRLSLVVTLAQDVVGAEAGGDGGQDAGLLPGTGSPVGLGALVLAAVLIGAGLALAGRGRRRSEDGKAAA